MARIRNMRRISADDLQRMQDDAMDASIRRELAKFKREIDKVTEEMFSPKSLSDRIARIKKRRQQKS